jgi:hypothetical protein
MPRCTCSAVVSDPDPTREDYLMKRHLVSGVHEDHRFLNPGEVWPPAEDEQP